MRSLPYSMLIAGLMAQSAIAQDVDTKRTDACIIEDAYAVNPKTGNSVSWTNVPRSFVLTYHFCRYADTSDFAEQNEAFPFAFARCKSDLADLQISTTLEGMETVWSGANKIFVDPLKTGPEAISVHAADFNAYRQATSLRIEPDDTFYLVRTAPDNDGITRIWTATGTCSGLE